MLNALIWLALLLATSQCLFVKANETDLEVQLTINRINYLLQLQNHIEKPVETALRHESGIRASDVELTLEQAQSILHTLEAQVNGTAVVGKRADSSTVKKWDLPIKFTLTNTDPGSLQYTDEEKEIIREGIGWWESSTCVGFIEYPDDISIGNSPHLLIVKRTGCLTNIGQTAELSQVVNLGSDCLKPGIAAHEIGHALGLNHEFTRPDRDNFITINSGNIITQDLYAFVKENSSNEFLGYPDTPYDATSVMHYGSMLPVDEFLKRRIIETKNPYKLTSMGQRTELSFLDVKRINDFYDCISWSCSTIRLAKPCQNGGYQDPKNCARCRCPPGLNGDFCEFQEIGQKISCGGVVNLEPCSTAVLTSPGHPGKYSAETKCSWLVNSTARGLIFGFESQPELPCTSGDTCLDYVEIRDNTSHLDVPGNRFCRCGKTAGRIAVVDAGQAFVYFHSTTARFGGGSYSGFKLNIFATCSNTLASDFTLECKIGKSGYDYEGAIAIGDSGRTCLSWASQTVYQAISFADRSLLEAQNYCRNPNSDIAPWCYIAAPSTFDYCSDIPKCENVPANSMSLTKKSPVTTTEMSPKTSDKNSGSNNYVPEHFPISGVVTDHGCRKTLRGVDYLGKLNVTRNGRPCQRWSEQWPHSHGYTNDGMFPDGSVWEAANYCRNPDPALMRGVWCLTMDKFIRWDICDVPFCGIDDDRNVEAVKTDSA